jgi:hypothetical protein
VRLSPPLDVPLLTSMSMDHDSRELHWAPFLFGAVFTQAGPRPSLLTDIGQQPATELNLGGGEVALAA